MREHSDRHDKPAEDRDRRDAGDFDSADPYGARRESDVRHIARTGLPPGVTPGDLFDPGAQPRELDVDRQRDTPRNRGGSRRWSGS